MFKDTRLGDDVAPYTADGLKVAVLGFKSPLWAVSTVRIRKIWITKNIAVIILKFE